MDTIKGFIADEQGGGTAETVVIGLLAASIAILAGKALKDGVLSGVSKVASFFGGFKLPSF